MRLEPARIPSDSVLDRVTIETALYASIFGVALFLRLFRLDLAPLSESEAAQAVAALRGMAVPPGASPLLYAVDAFVLSIFSPGDAAVRLAPAVAGASLVLAPALFRDALGRLGALGAAVVLALSPVMLVASRSLDAEVIAAVCALIIIAAVERYRSTAGERYVTFAAVALGIGLASGSGMYTALLALGASWLVLRLTLRDGETHVPPPALPNLVRPGLVAIASLVLAATGGLTNTSGLAAAGDLFGAWLRGFGTVGGSSAFDVIQVLIAYELLALMVGIGGLWRAWRRADRLGVWLGFAAIVGISIVVLRSGRRPTDLVVPLAFLALLSAHAIQPWAEAMLAKASLATDGVVLALGTVMLGVMALTLTAYVRATLLPVPVGPVVLQPVLFLLGIFIVLPGAIGLLLATMVDVAAVLRAAMTIGLALLTLVSIGAGWGVAQVRAGDPREIVLGSVVTSTDVRALVDTARQIAVRSQGNTAALPIRVELEDPVMAWYFRDANILPNQVAPGVLTAAGQTPRVTDATYIGARFVTRETWDTLGLDLETWLEWLLYRSSGAEQPLPVQVVTLWQKQ